MNESFRTTHMQLIKVQKWFTHHWLQYMSHAHKAFAYNFRFSSYNQAHSKILVTFIFEKSNNIYSHVAKHKNNALNMPRNIGCISPTCANPTNYWKEEKPPWCSGYVTCLINQGSQVRSRVSLVRQMGL